jgi:hypothetical protein
MAVYYVVSPGGWRKSRRGRVKIVRRTALNSLHHTVSSAIKQKEKSSAQIHEVIKDILACRIWKMEACVSRRFSLGIPVDVQLSSVVMKFGFLFICIVKHRLNHPNSVAWFIS